jgi:hypothetical protein
MVTFYELGNLGRLGNQLFQYAALRALGLKNGYETKIPDPQERHWHGQNCLLDKFNIESSYLEQSDLPKIQGTYSEPDYMSFDERFFSLPDNINLTGFFQSTHYFGGFERQIKKELRPNLELCREAEKHISVLKQRNPGYEIVSLHLRRGDNTDNTDPSQTAVNNFYGPQGTPALSKSSFYYEYFSNARNVFEGKKVKYLVFTGGKRGSDDNTDDIAWCRQSFVGDDFIFSEGKTALEDFSLITSCDHNIISHVSSFGWWAAYVNNSPTKTVVAPTKYHPDHLEIDYRPGFYPKEWNLV